MRSGKLLKKGLIFLGISTGIIILLILIVLTFYLVGPFLCIMSLVILCLGIIIVPMFIKIKDTIGPRNLMVGIIFLVIAGSIIGLLLSATKKPEFTRFTDGVSDMLRRGNPILYTENILVKNVPRNGLDQYKMMIAYFDSLGLSTRELSEIPRIQYYHMWFYKSTYITRKYFTEKRKHRRSKTFGSIESDVYLGRIAMFHCGHDSTEWVIKVIRKIGIDDDDYAINESTILSNQCGASIGGAEENDRLLGYFIGGAKENDALVKYYMELKDKKNANR